MLYQALVSGRFEAHNENSAPLVTLHSSTNYRQAFASLVVVRLDKELIFETNDSPILCPHSI